MNRKVSGIILGIALALITIVIINMISENKLIDNIYSSLSQKSEEVELTDILTWKICNNIDDQRLYVILEFNNVGGIDKIIKPNGESINCNGKTNIGIDYITEMDKEEKFEIVRTDGSIGQTKFRTSKEIIKNQIDERKQQNGINVNDLVYMYNGMTFKITDITDGIMTLACQTPAYSKTLSGSDGYNNYEMYLNSACEDLFTEDPRIMSARSANLVDYNANMISKTYTTSYWVASQIVKNPYGWEYCVYIVNEAGLGTATLRSVWPTTGVWGQAEYSHTFAICPIITMPISSIKAVNDSKWGIKEYNEIEDINEAQIAIAFKEIKEDIINKIAELKGSQVNGDEMNQIEEYMTQAQMELILEKYGVIEFDGNNNILGVRLNNSDIYIEMSEIYSGEYKTEESVADITVYTFEKSNEDMEVNKIQEFIVPQTGEYQIQCWGAQGGTRYYGNGGKGAYTKGNIRLRQGEKIYICIGEQGQTENSQYGGFNGGGYSRTDSFSTGGGATDIRLIKGDSIYDDESLASRIMVAAGGAGGNAITGLPGGTLTAKINHQFEGTIASQVAGGINGGFGKATIMDGYNGAGGGYYSGGYVTYTGSTVDQYIGSEGQTVKLDGTYLIKYGANGYWAYGTFTDSVYLSNSVFGDPIVGTVKSGYIVGVTPYLSTGGSSYISGHEGCIAIKSSTEIVPKVDNYTVIEDSIHYSNRYFKNTLMCAGDETAEDNCSGKTGDGKVVITFIK